MDWKDQIREYAKTMPQMQATRKIIQEYHLEDMNFETVRHYCRPKKVSINKVTMKDSELPAILKSGSSVKEIAASINVSERVAQAMIEDLKDKGLCIECEDEIYKTTTFPQGEVKTIVNNWNGEKVIRFGLTGDKHFGSKFVQIEHMHRAYEVFRAEGITDVYDTGDITEGENMRPGHAYECYVHGADDYIDEVCKNHPQIDGMTTHYILGNHDLSFVKHVGMNIGKAISQNRPDLDYLGISQAYIKLTPNCTLELRHPGGGSAYSISYKPQKMVDAMPGGEKPSILALGHFHKIEYLFYRNIHIFQTGTLQAQSNFMRDNSLAAHMGYWIITCHVRDDGEIARIVPECIPFYRAIPDDWKNWRRP